MSLNFLMESAFLFLRYSCANFACCETMFRENKVEVLSSNINGLSKLNHKNSCIKNAENKITPTRKLAQ